MTFFVMNLACFLLKIGSAPNFRPAFKFFSWQSALTGSIMSAVAMFFIDETYAASAICLLFFLFLIIHYMSPPKHWGDVSQNLIYHQVRKYLLRLKPEHIKFWRPQIILLINNPRRHTRLIQFCNSMKKGSLYILGHAIVTDDFDSGIHEAKLQQTAWTKYISESSRIKAFVQLTMSPTIEWGVRNLILSAGLGGMRPNIAILGFYNMDELRRAQPLVSLPSAPPSPSKAKFDTGSRSGPVRRRRGDTSARLLESSLPTDAIRTEDMLSPTSYLTIVEDLALKHRLNVAIGKNFQSLETPRQDGNNSKKYVDLWPIHMSAEMTADDKNVLTSNFDTCRSMSHQNPDVAGQTLMLLVTNIWCCVANIIVDTLILQLGFILQSVPNWKRAFNLRILVFVEYDTEVDEEKARLQALLEKLRIDAEVHVFWLASGALATYEYVVNGKVSCGADKLVDQLLEGDEWWQQLQDIRGDVTQPKDTFNLGQSLATDSRRSSLPPANADTGESSRRARTQGLLDLRKNPTVSKVAKLGVNVGIRTHHLTTKVLDNGLNQPRYNFSDEEADASSSSEADFNDDAPSENNVDLVEPQTLALLHPSRRKTIGDPRQQSHSQHTRPSNGSNTPNYGAITSVQNPAETWFLTMTPVEAKRSDSTEALLTETPDSVQHAENYPAVSRQATRPALSRNSSMGRFSSRPVPETRVQTEEGGGQRLVFAEETESPRTPYIRSRRNSVSQRAVASNVNLNIPELLEGYSFEPSNEAEAQSNYSTQSLPLSFNGLPSRAQHLILNELMRQNSNDTAVLLTTLPIPEEGTCKSEDQSLKYLSDIEVLCHELPPVLLVLSNNMTVTVSL